MAENKGGISATAFMGSQPSAAEVQTNRILASNQASLDAANIQLVRISTQMSQFGNSLTRISGLLTESFALERLKEQQQQRQERILAEQALREGQESIVERKLQTALAQPIQKVGAKTQGTLNGLMRFFTFFLGGWLSFQGVKALQAYSDGNKKKLQEISKNTLKGLAIIGTVFGSIKLGIFSAVSALIRTGAYIGQSVLNGIFRAPIEYLKEAVSKIKIPGLSKIAKKVKPAKSPTLRAANILTSSPGGRITALLTGAVNMFSGKGVGQSAAGAATAGLGAAALSKIPLGPLNPAKGLLAFLAIPALNQAGMNAYDITKQYFTQNKLDFSGLNITSKLGGIQNIFTKEPDTSKAPDIVARPAAQISPSSQSDVSAQIGPEPQAQTQVVLTDATSDQQPQEVPSTTGNVTDLPAVMSSNLDNFYLLYSQVQYNVVI